MTTIHPPPGIQSIRHLLEDPDSDCPRLLISGNGIDERERCPRASSFRYIHNRQSGKSKPEQVFGRIMHEVFRQGDIRQQAGLPVEAKLLEPALDELYKTAGDAIPFDDYRHLGRAKEVLHGYYKEYSEKLWEVVCTECEFPNERFESKLGIVEGVLEKPIQIIWHGFKDLVVRDLGKLHAANWRSKWVVDRKTSKDYGDKFWDSYVGPNVATTGYCWAEWRETGEAPHGFIIDAIIVRKPATRVSKNPPNEYHQRAFFVTESKMLQWERNTMAVARNWLGYVRDGYFPQHDRKGFNCQFCCYQQVCAQVDEQSAYTLLMSGDYQERSSDRK